MSIISFLNIGMHGYINPTLPIVAELTRRGNAVTYHTFPAFATQIEAAGAMVRLCSEDSQPLPNPPIPLLLLEGLARTTLAVLPGVLSDLRAIRPDLIVHGAACPWGAVAARELAIPAAATFTTFAFNRETPSPTALSRAMIAAVGAYPLSGFGYARARWALGRRYDTSGLSLLDLMNTRAPLNLVFTTREFQSGADAFGPSYRFVGTSVGSRPAYPEFDTIRLEDPVLYASLGTVFEGGATLLRNFATALAPLGGTVVVSTGNTDPADLAPLPPNVLARRTVPQLQVLDRAALFVTHGGMNSVNEAMLAGVPMLVVPLGADQPLVARRVVELGAGLALRADEAAVGTVHGHARRLLRDPRFREAAAAQRAAHQQAGGVQRAADELELYLEARRGAPTVRAGGR